MAQGFALGVVASVGMRQGVARIPCRIVQNRLHFFGQNIGFLCFFACVLYHKRLVSIHAKEATPKDRDMNQLLLILILNFPNGQQTEISLSTMKERECLEVMHDIWAAKTSIAYIDETGTEWRTVDAACLPTE